jgi:hypothetical protein
VLCELKQPGKTTLVNDETVLYIKVKTTLEKERPVSMTGLSVRMNCPLACGLVERD